MRLPVVMSVARGLRMITKTNDNRLKATVAHSSCLFLIGRIRVRAPQSTVDVKARHMRADKIRIAQ